MSCLHCNYEGLQEGSRYCPNCGGPVSPAPQVDVRQEIGTVQRGARVVGVEIGNWITHVLSPSEEQAQARQQRERWDMLGWVEGDWIQGLLEPSLQGQVLIALGMEERADAVEAKGAWDDVVRMPGEARQPLAQGATVVDAFERSKHSLLILGEPGAGKSIMLLELARETLERARRDPLQPIPTVLHLTSWAEEQRPVEEWLVQELRTRYDRPRKVARSWVEDDELLLLLDGLDEVRAEAREACVQALNAFRAEHPVPMLVCCRVEEWQALNTQLKLGGAVLLHPLTPEQIDGYLERAGGELEALSLALQRDPDLRELAETPLTLSVMTRAYRGASAAQPGADCARHPGSGARHAGQSCC